MDARAEELRTWLETEAGLTDFEIVPASEDASFRRYFRVHTADGTRIAMDAPPEREDSRPFVEIAGWLELIGVNAPRILAANLRRGVLLRTALGALPNLPALGRAAGADAPL